MMYASLSGTRIYFGVEGMGRVIDNLCSCFSDEAPSTTYTRENNMVEQAHRIIMTDEYELIETVSGSVTKRLVSGDKS
ncbi:hypothetical protein J31TS6_16600 [Brevibacillus reuszeri]|uniref:hypothetical protein n=1 Tax=Brevibacillus reuszeri TaxID=54915 RepID=UPI001B0F19C0|nr:hypothetical protein [Brevibacillus reuszeri]GIO05632.1 hypothetical protein J31TS6_16600 [Brevibacillus reuszeri]